MKIKIIDFGLKKNHFPFRPHANDAGADVFMPYDYTLNPGEVARIPLGFGLIIPEGFAGYVFPKSSMAAKGLVCELPPIDSGYRGEIHTIISNVGTQSQTLHKDTRVGQLVITPVLIADFVLDLGDSRKNGAFGSTGKYNIYVKKITLPKNSWVWQLGFLKTVLMYELPSINLIQEYPRKTSSKNLQMNWLRNYNRSYILKYPL